MRPVLAFAFLLVAAPAFAQTPLTGSTGEPTTNTRPLSGTAVQPGPAAGRPSGPSTSEAAPATEAEPRAQGRGMHTHGKRRSLAERFAEANTTHDGHLTLAQARDARMNEVVRDFGLIDKDKKGYVTVDGIKQFRHERRAARAAAEAR